MSGHFFTSAQDISTTSSESIIKDFKDFSTDYNRGRFSANSNSKVIEETVATQNITQISSNLNAKNNIAITSNKDLNILSSNLNAGTNPSATDLGSISLTSTNGNVNILALNNLQTTTTQTKEGTQTLSFGIGNSHIDTAYAEKDAIDAARNLADAKSQLNRIETKYKNNEATEEAVEDAKTNLTIALANLALAEVKLAASAAKSAASIGDLYTGFYGDVRLETTGTKTNSSTSSSNAIASNLTSNGNLTINSGLSLTNQITKDLGNTKILGSNLNSAEGDITITSKNNTTIQASKDTYKDSTTSKTWSESLTLSSSAGSGTGTAIDKIVTAAQIALGAGISKSQSDTNSTTYNNSSLTALNGNIKINSIGQSNINNSENPSNTDNPNNINNTNNNQTTTIKGANLLAENITINTQGNLTLESLQNQYTQKSKSYGFNLGAGAGLANSGLNSVNLGINSSNSNNDRLWTDNQTTIIATNSVTINTKDNTNITGALIANAIVNNTQTNQDNQNNQTTTPSTIDLTKLTDLGNVTINTKTLTFKDLKDHDNQQSSNSSFITNIGKGISTNEASNQTTTQSQPNPNQQKNYYPNGSTTIILGSQGQIKEQETKATIGQGVINTNSTITFNSNGDATTIDNSNSSSELTSNNKTTNNQTINRDINNSQVITKDTTAAALDVNTTIDNRILAAPFSKEAWNQLKDEQNNFGKNLKTSIKAQAQLIDAPLTLAATADIPLLSEAASHFATKNGGLATLATQLFGLGYILNSNDYKLITVKEGNANKITLALKEESENPGSNVFKLGQSKDLDQGYLIVTDKLTGEEKARARFDLASKDLQNIDFMDYLTTSDNGNHGINNTNAEGYRNGRTQLGNLQNINPKNNEGMFVIGSAPSHGVVPDMIENLYNTVTGLLPFGSYLKSGNVIAGNEFRGMQSTIKSTPQITLDQDQFNYLKSQNINPQIISKDGNFYAIENPLKLLRFADHSNGVDRDQYAFQSLYQPKTTVGQIIQIISPPALTGSILKVIEGDPQNKSFAAGEYYDAKLKQTVALPGAFIQAYGGATGTQRLGEAASRVGVWMDREQIGIDAYGNPKYSYNPGQIINPGDPVPNLMGLNFQNLNDITSSIKNTAYLDNADKSPHGTYICKGSFCGYNGFDDLKKLQQQPNQ